MASPPDSSVTMTNRKRTRKACNACRRRKRKCDGKYPCNTCTTYEYNCSYADDAADTPDRGVDTPPAKRVSLDGQSSTTSQAAATPRGPNSPSQGEKGTREANDSSEAPPPAGIFDEHKTRYAGASAAMAFPHILGGLLELLGSDNPSKMHALAYNFGIRPEEAANTHALLGTLISEDNLGFFSRVYFSALAPIGDVLDPKIYAERCRDYYHGPSRTDITFGAVAAGVAALGSFLSPTRHPREADLVQYAKAILDDPASMRLLGIDHVVAWAMRVLYLRATSRPNNAWMASCTMMHLCEAVGLHEEGNIKKMASVAGAAALGHDADWLRRIFWISWAGHNLLSYEYDRSAVRFRAVTCQAMMPTAGSVADQFVRIVQIIPTPNSPFHLEPQPLTPREDLFERLKALEKLQVTNPFLVVTKADLAFCFYRRIYLLKLGISDEIMQLVIDLGNAAVDAAQQLADQGRLFWNVIGSVFQYTCVLLAMDTPAASVHVAAAFEGLESLVEAADTGPTREALSMARRLLAMHAAKKRRELALLEAVEAGHQSSQAEADLDDNATVLDMDLDWEQFPVEPYLCMFGPDN